ncbi:MAG: hypothetical protein KBD67_01845 [Anaerolineaceae bacterium]|nr:hypothetical protein [Anaerolineaceae bacterium]
MSILFSIPIIVILLIIQTTIARQVTLISGSVDLVLIWLAAWGLKSRDNSGYYLAVIAGLLVAYITALPWYVYLTTYFSVIIIAKLIIQRQWQSPLLSMFFITLVSSILLYGLTVTALSLSDVSFHLIGAIDTIIIPSVFLNLFLSIPVYVIVKDFSNWIYRSKEVT